VTKFIIRWAPVDGSPSYAFDATASPGYVWHCHILEHEENGMMRRLTLMAPPPPKLGPVAGILPEAASLSQNYPNPFNAETQIRFTLPQATQVTLAIYNLLGQEVKQLASAQFAAGEQVVTWNGTNNDGAIVPSGVYFYRLKAGDSVENMKMTLLK